MATTDIKKLENLVKEILEKINNFDGQVPDKASSAEFTKKLEALNKKFDKKSKDVINEIQVMLEKYKNTEDELIINTDPEVAKDIKGFVAVITNEMMELKEQFEKFSTEYSDLTINTSMTASKEIFSLKNCVLALNDTMDSIKEKFASYDFKEELTPSISENVSISVIESLNSYLGDFKNEIFNLLAKISESIKNVIDNQKIFEGIELSLGEIIQTQQKNKEEILKIISTNISDEHKKLLPQILQMINGITFDDAAEEIKDGIYAVNENIGIVNKNVETSSMASKKILEKFEDLNKTFDKSEIAEKIAKIDSVLESVSAEFNVITKGSRLDTGDYVYTLLDLESDISKVRVVLNELNNTINDDRSLAESVTKNLSDKIANVNSFIEKTAKLYADTDYKSLLAQFDTLNDDITSISKRTNKLILTSDDSAVKLQKNIEDFQNIMKKISNTVENFEKSNILKALVERTEYLKKFMKSSIQSDNAINEAFMYLASWIDNTTVEIENIQKGITEVKQKSYEKDLDEIKSLIKTNEGTSNECDLSKIEKLIKDTNKKISDNTSRIDALEEKFDLLISQVQTINDNITLNKTSNKKIDKIEKQIQQLISYVEED